MDQFRQSEIFSEVKIFSSEVFHDFRGTYTESYNDIFFKQHAQIEFIQDDFSVSKKNVLRGLHGDYETWKLVSCPYGEIFFAIADMRKGSSTQYKSETFILSQYSPNFILIPPGFANGHLVLSDFAVFHYKQSTLYGTKQFTIKHDDARLNIFWPNFPVIKSIRDT